MSNSSVDLLGIQISRKGLDGALESCEKRARMRQGGYVCFVNVHTLTESTGNGELRSALTSSSFNFADGVPLVWLSRIKGQPILSRVCGPDFMKALLSRSEFQSSHGFIGGTAGQAEAVAKQFHLSGAICFSPPFRPFSEKNAKEDWNRFLESCPNRQAPTLVWVGLGAPKQEHWMRTVSALAPTTLFFGVGAAFDFLAGTKARAPYWMQKAGLEWIFRLLQEPRRLGVRYLTTNSRFLGEVLKSLWS